MVRLIKPETKGFVIDASAPGAAGEVLGLVGHFTLPGKRIAFEVCTNG